MDERPGCLGGLLRIAIIGAVYKWLQSNFGFRRGGCCGIGCGAVLVILLILFVCGTCAGTDWFRLGF